VIGTTVSTLLDACLSVVVVTGRDAALVEREIVSAFHHHFSTLLGDDDEKPAETISIAFNPEWETAGLGRSIAVGVSAAPEADGYLIALGDMPGIRQDVIGALLEALESEGDETIVLPVYEDEPDRPGHPVFFGRAYRAALESLTGDEGARSILRANRESVRRVAVTGGLEDIDLPEDVREV